METIHKVTRLGGKSHNPRVVQALMRKHTEDWNEPFREQGGLTRRGRLARGVALLLLPTTVGVLGMKALEGGSGSSQKIPATTTASPNASQSPTGQESGTFIDLAAPHKEIQAKPGDSVSGIAANELPDLNNTVATDMITRAIMEQYKINDEYQARIIQPNEWIPLPDNAVPGEGVKKVPGTSNVNK